MKTSQNENILEYMRKHGSITPVEALKFLGCMRLSGRIFELRKAGHMIITKTRKTEDGKQYAEYFLKERNDG